MPPRIQTNPSAEADDLLPDRFRRWFAARGWSPREHQLALLAKARDDRSALLIAPTGAGKTLAGFHSPYFLDGITFSYTPDDYTRMKTLYISIFNGKDWDISDKPVTE